MNILVILLLICLFIVLIIVGYDIYYKLNTWQKRIHIGRWSDFEEWYVAISKCANKWLKKTPIVSKSDNERLILIDIFNNNHVSLQSNLGRLRV